MTKKKPTQPAPKPAPKPAPSLTKKCSLKDVADQLES